VTNAIINYATPADAARAAKETLKRLLVGRTARTEALLDYNPEMYVIGNRVDEVAIRAWVRDNSDPGRVRTKRVDGHPAGGGLYRLTDGEHVTTDEETNND
jgi:hypothetical protein